MSITLDSPTTATDHTPPLPEQFKGMAYPTGLLAMYQQLHNFGVILSYQGWLDGDMIESLIHLTEKTLISQAASVKARKKIINILIECLQNSFHYTNRFTEESHPEGNQAIKFSPFLLLGRSDEAYWIYTGNALLPEDVPSLVERINTVYVLEDEALQQHYREILDKESLPQSGGAGLGLVDIIRRCNHQILFSLHTDTDTYPQFSLLVKISM